MNADAKRYVASQSQVNGVRSILSEEDFALTLAEQHSVIYFFVDWSVYAVQGRRMLEELELLCSPDLKGTFWIADVSDIESPGAFLGEWLKHQERSDLKIFSLVASGSGPVVWLNRGAVVDFAQSATHHDVQDFVSEPRKHSTTAQHNTRLERTRHERVSLLSCVGERLKRQR